MIYSLILCAGKQSRFKSETPKALVDLKGKTLLERNIENASTVADKVFTVCSFQNENKFNVENKIAIESGQGSGDSVWKALSFLPLKKEDSVFIMWGDALHDKKTFEILKKKLSRHKLSAMC